jgi:DHA3 family macrolide efflux protein-like MFS transporter
MVEDRRWMMPFFTIWTGQACSLLGSALVQFALIWWLTESTGSATVLALAALVAMLPQVVLGPLAGTLVDRWDRRAVMMAADSLIALATAALVIAFATNVVAPWHVYLILAVRSAGSGFHVPAMQASTSLMVPDKHLARVSGLNQALNGAMNVAAPPLGALLLKVLPVQGVLMIDIGTAALAVLPLLVVAVPQPERRATGKGLGAIRQDFETGLRYVAGWPGLLVLLVMAMMINFCLFPAFSLLPILVTERFGGDALELAWMESAWGLGLILGGMTLGVWGGFKRRIVTFLVGLVGLGLGLLWVGLTPSMALGMALGAMWFAGMMAAIHGGPYIATLQAAVAPEMQGRVLSLVSSGMAAIAPVGLAIAGPVTDAAGPTIWYIVGGVLCILMGAVGLHLPVLLDIEDNRRAARQPA